MEKEFLKKHFFQLKNFQRLEFKIAHTEHWEAIATMKWKWSVNKIVKENLEHDK